jgi:hypothetical protein
LIPDYIIYTPTETEIEMTKTTNIQLRGICQCCGREQAVMGGRMSKHGYEVKDGWFNGVCTGQHYEPMEVSREQADRIIREVEAECVELRQRAADLTRGKVRPLTAKSGKKAEVKGVPYYKWEDEMVPFAQAESWHQAEAVRSAVWNATRRAEIGECFAVGLGVLADKWHGQALREVVKAAPAEPIRQGEQRKAESGTILTVRYVEGARVYWATERGSQGWTGTQAFRKLVKV